MIDPKKVDSIEVFLALSMLFEFESSDRLRELAGSLREHAADDLAELLDKLASHSDKHGEEIRELADGHVLPDLATMDVTWEGLEGPETTAYEDIKPEMAITDVLQIALRNEIKGQDFYCQISLNSPDAAVRELSAEFANEENEHVKMLEDWISQHSS